jgi:hypothetical protein
VDSILAAAADSFLAAVVTCFMRGKAKAGEGANEQGNERPLHLGRRRVDAGGDFWATPARPSREARFELLTRAGLRGPFRAKWAVPG